MLLLSSDVTSLATRLDVRTGSRRKRYDDVGAFGVRFFFRLFFALARDSSTAAIADVSSARRDDVTTPLRLSLLDVSLSTTAVFVAKRTGARLIAFMTSHHRMHVEQEYVRKISTSLDPSI